MSYELQNPLLQGFYPDPSIVRVEDDFYMVTSSFSYFPGVPVFHSQDLAHWEQIGHVLNRTTQLPLGADFISGGIYAPTIRYKDGMFYVITTNVGHGGNFIVTAEKPEGPWSEPHWIDGAEGIDPSLFWDDDGTAYYTGTSDSNSMRGQEIWISEIDLNTFELVGEKKKIWGGAMKNAWCPEAPHLYKKDGWYYLMIAEGGTGYFHSVTIARSRTVTGYYEGYDGNPILTHRNLGHDALITNTGHADLVELKDGSWYMVFLASRPYGGQHKNMGRETFIAPMIWEDGWPVVCPGKGVVEWSYPAPELPEYKVEKKKETDHFDTEELGMEWNFLGTPKADMFKLENSCLSIRTLARPLEWLGQEHAKAMLADKEKSVNCAGFVGRRQQHKSYQVEVKMKFLPKEEQTAGLIILQNNYHSLRLEMALENGEKVLRVIKGYTTLTADETYGIIPKPYQKKCCGKICWKPDTVILKIRASEQEHRFSVCDENGMETVLADGIDGGILGSETAGGFVGAYIGMFASGNGREGQNFADFDYFTYHPEE